VFSEGESKENKKDLDEKEKSKKKKRKETELESIGGCGRETTKKVDSVYISGHFSSYSQQKGEHAEAKNKGERGEKNQTKNKRKIGKGKKRENRAKGLLDCLTMSAHKTVRTK
jgi:hypothetical protein